MPLESILADLTTLRVDAVVNAANERLLGGGGVDGAIHRAGGPRLLEACRALAEVRPGVRCPPGETRVTPGFDLPAKFVIHTVGPVWNGGGAGEESLLASCYRNAVEEAEKLRLASIAFPAISTGIYGFPADRAARIAVKTIRAYAPETLRVLLVSFDLRGRGEIKKALAAG